MKTTHTKKLHEFPNLLLILFDDYKIMFTFVQILKRGLRLKSLKDNIFIVSVFMQT